MECGSPGTGNLGGEVNHRGGEESKGQILLTHANLLLSFFPPPVTIKRVAR